MIVEVDPFADPRWDAFVEAHPDARVFHHSLWLRCLRRESGRRPLALAWEGPAGRLEGVLPLLETRGLPFVNRQPPWGPRLSSLPRTPLAGVVSDDASAAVALLEAAMLRARARGVPLQLKTERGDLADVAAGLARVPWRTTYVRELPEASEQLRFGNSRNHSRIRWAVSRARASGVSVRPAEREDDVRAWYRLYLETMRSHAVPPRSLGFFKELWRRLRPRGYLRLLLAEQRTPAGIRLLAGSIFLLFGRTVFYAFTGATRAGLGAHPHDLIQWQAMHDACDAGYRRYDLGEVARGQEGLAAFKRKWGADPASIFHYYAPPIANLDDPFAAEAESSLRTTLWQRVPLPATRAAGLVAYAFM